MKTAFVTGAAQGIGAAIAVRLGAEGYRVACADVNEAGAGETAAKIGNGSKAIALDVSDTAAGAAATAWTERELGPVEVLVNVAGICPTRPFFEIDEASFRKVFDINVTGLFFLSQAVAKSMAERRRGAIINIASVSGFLPKLEQLDYGASKAAVVSLTRSTALSLGPLGIRVNAIAPGFIDTPLTRDIAQARSAIRGVTPQETLQPMIDSLPLKRIGTAEEVAEMAAFLASDRASYVTGQTFDVCGGQLMR